MRFFNRKSLALACVSLALGAIATPGLHALPWASAQESSKSETLSFANGKITVEKPASWKTVPPKSNIVQYEFRAPAEGEQTARVTVMGATGGIEANIVRWIGQFDGLTRADAKIDKKTIQKATVHIIELEGTYKDSMGGGPFAPGPVKKMENHAMIGLIFELEGGELVFVKMTGPKKTVVAEKEAVMKMVEGLKTK
ncbi:MAG: hypothetical protein LW850_32680 [Planctomycetaceae bacterium]|jgi:hypothetical protein|nr:hypothetical protein [Planctomycetaceae bacterium]MCE2815162.1 hypothetical protein [Planctomycetaceae bacterium]